MKSCEYSSSKADRCLQEVIENFKLIKFRQVDSDKYISHDFQCWVLLWCVAWNLTIHAQREINTGLCSYIFFFVISFRSHSRRDTPIEWEMFSSNLKYWNEYVICKFKKKSIKLKWYPGCILLCLSLKFLPVS